MLEALIQYMVLYLKKGDYFFYTKMKKEKESYF